MLSQSINYLRESEDVFKTVFVGGILLLLGFLIVPTFTVIGYLMRVLRRTSDGDDEAPTFDSVDEGIEMTVEGLKGFVVAFAYGLVPAIIGGVLVGGAVLSFIVGGAADSGGFLGLGFIGLLFGILVSIVLGLIAAYVIPAALANVAEKGTIGAGFAFGTLGSVLTSGTYAKGWLLSFAVIVLGGIVLSVLSVVPLLGTVIGVFVQFYFLVAAYYIIGHTWGELVTPKTGDGEAPSEQAAV
jgi:hypothetical protein